MYEIASAEETYYNLTSAFCSSPIAALVPFFKSTTWDTGVMTHTLKMADEFVSFHTLTDTSREERDIITYLYACISKQIQNLSSWVCDSDPNLKVSFSPPQNFSTQQNEAWMTLSVIWSVSSAFLMKAVCLMQRYTVIPHSTSFKLNVHIMSIEGDL